MKTDFFAKLQATQSVAKYKIFCDDVSLCVNIMG